MLCPQCGKSIENLSAKVTLCENCLALKEENHNTSSGNPDGQELPKEEKVEPIKEKKPVNRKSKKSKKRTTIMFAILMLEILIIILFNTFSSGKSKEKSRPKKVSALVESFSKEKSEVVSPAKPYPTPTAGKLDPIPSPVEKEKVEEEKVEQEKEEVAETAPEQEPTIAEANKDEAGLDDLEASIKELESIEAASPTDAIVAPSEVISPFSSPTVEITPSASLTLTSPTPQVSPSPEKTIDETKLSEFDRRVLHTKRLKELEKK